MSRFKDFSDDEVYILSRQAIHASADIVLSGKYGEECCKVHTDLMNELILERKERDYGTSVKIDSKDSETVTNTIPSILEEISNKLNKGDENNDTITSRNK